MSFLDFFGVRHGGYRPKGDGHDGPKGPPPETGSGVQPPAFVPDAESSAQIGRVGSVVFGPPGSPNRMPAAQGDGPSAFFRIETGQLSPEEVAAERDSFEKRGAERVAEMKRQAREVLVEKAALAILQGAWACPGNSVPDPRYLWLMAQQFVDAREADLAQFKDSLKGADQ